MQQSKRNKSRAMPLGAFQASAVAPLIQSASAATSASSRQTPKMAWGVKPAAPIVSLKDIAQAEKTARDAQERMWRDEQKQLRLAEVQRIAAAAAEEQHALDEAARWEEERPQREALAAKHAVEEQARRLQQAQQAQQKLAARKAADRREEIADIRKAKNGLKKLLVMTPEMEQFLDQHKGSVSFEWFRKHFGNHEVHLDMEGVLSCHAEYFPDGEYSDSTQDCSLTFTEPVAARALANSIRAIALDLFVGYTITGCSIQEQVLKEIALELVQTDSAEACHPTASLVARRAIDAWIEAQQAEREQRIREYDTWNRDNPDYVCPNVPLADVSEDESLETFYTLLSTHKAAFDASMEARIEAICATFQATQQLLDHVSCINKNLDAIADALARKEHIDRIANTLSRKDHVALLQENANEWTTFRQNNANEWTALVKLTSIPLAMALVLLSRSGNSSKYR
jgi:hypothetical protein